MNMTHERSRIHIWTLRYITCSVSQGPAAFFVVDQNIPTCAELRELTQSQSNCLLVVETFLSHTSVTLKCSYQQMPTFRIRTRVRISQGIEDASKTGKRILNQLPVMRLGHGNRAATSWLVVITTHY